MKKVFLVLEWDYGEWNEGEEGAISLDPNNIGYKEVFHQADLFPEDFKIVGVRVEEKNENSNK